MIRRRFIEWATVRLRCRYCGQEYPPYVEGMVSWWRKCPAQPPIAIYVKGQWHPVPQRCER